MCKIFSIVKSLDREIPVRYATLDGAEVVNEQRPGAILGLSYDAGEFRLETTLQPLTNLKFNLVDVRKELAAKDFNGKVVRGSNTCPEGCCVRFTSMPPGIEGYFQAIIDRELKEANRASENDSIHKPPRLGGMRI